jgi:cell wall-associated NlpC family hydrolase
MGVEDDRAARLLEQLLTDPQLRARFRRDPAAVAREADLDELAGDFGGSAMQTLEARESRSSLAGVMMAAALEGITGLGLAHHATVPGHGLSPEVHRVLERHQEAAAPVAAAGAADLATPEGAAAHLDAAQPSRGWASGDPGQAGSYPAIDPTQAQGGNGHGAADPLDGTDEGGDDEGGDDEGGDDEGGDDEDDDEPDEDEPDDSDDALDETTHDQDSSGDSGDEPSDSGDEPSDGSDEPSDGGTTPTGGGDPSDGGTTPTGGGDPSDDGDLQAGNPDPIDEVAAPGAGGDAPGDYPGDDAGQADVAAWMAAEARSRGLPPELPVMAALTESNMKNLNYGDADSVGFFQMRSSVWDNGRYAGYADKPELQVRWFLDKALEVKQQRVAQGKSVDDPGQYGDWIADVERPAEQYRGRYQGNYDAAHALVENNNNGNDDNNDDGAPVLDAAADAGPGVADLHAGAPAVEAVAEARKYLGTPYQWGGSSPQTGFDCSGLVQYAYAKAGVRIPRVTEQQFVATNGDHIGRDDLLPGDVVFFRDPSGDVHHEGIYLGDDKFLHAPHTGDVVKVSSLKQSYYAQEFAGGRRFAGAEQVAAAAREAPTPQAVASRSARAALAALERDADEARRPGTRLFQAVRAQEERKNAIAYPD